MAPRKTPSPPRKRTPEAPCGCTAMVSVGDSPGFTEALDRMRTVALAAAAVRYEEWTRHAVEYRGRIAARARVKFLEQVREEEESAFQC